MKVSESLKIIDEGWVKKPKGFRVHFQKRVGSEWITDYAPGEEEKASGLGCDSVETGMETFSNHKMRYLGNQRWRHGKHLCGR